MTSIWLALMFVAGFSDTLAFAQAPSSQSTSEPASPITTPAPSSGVQPPPAKPLLERILDGLIGGILGGALVKAVDYFFQIRLERGKAQLQRKQERIKEKHELADEISLHFNQFIALLRDLHEAERKLRQAREVPLAGQELAELERTHLERRTVFQPVQNILWQKLDKLRRVFDTDPPKTTYEGFRQWYIDQMERNTILSFGPGSEIIIWRDRVLQSLNQEIAGQ